jgi:hypothetical protein
MCAQCKVSDERFAEAIALLRRPGEPVDGEAARDVARYAERHGSPIHANRVLSRSEA